MENPVAGPSGSHYIANDKRSAACQIPILAAPVFYGAILALTAGPRRRRRATRPSGAGTAVSSDPPAHPDAGPPAGVERHPMAGRGALRPV